MDAHAVAEVLERAFRDGPLEMTFRVEAAAVRVAIVRRTPDGTLSDIVEQELVLPACESRARVEHFARASAAWVSTVDLDTLAISLPEDLLLVGLLARPDLQTEAEFRHVLPRDEEREAARAWLEVASKLGVPEAGSHSPETLAALAVLSPRQIAVLDDDVEAFWREGKAALETLAAKPQTRAAALGMLRGIAEHDLEWAVHVDKPIGFELLEAADGLGLLEGEHEVWFRQVYERGVLEALGHL